jgi:hypothetical protein
MKFIKRLCFDARKRINGQVGDVRLESWLLRLRPSMKVIWSHDDELCLITRVGCGNDGANPEICYMKTSDKIVS